MSFSMVGRLVDVKLSKILSHSLHPYFRFLLVFFKVYERVENLPFVTIFNSLVGADFNTGVGLMADGSGSFNGLSTVTGGNLIVGLIVCWFCECTLEVWGHFAGGDGFDFFLLFPDWVIR